MMDLLPQHPHSLIVDPKTCHEILTLLHSLMVLLIDGLRKFYIDKDYNYFDPHVGENACQIRAYILMLLSKKHNINKTNERIHLLSQKIDNIENLLKTKAIYQIDGKNLEIIEFLHKYNLVFKLYTDEVIVYKSYFLTFFRKKSDDNFFIDDALISACLQISRRMSKRITHQYQVFLSRISCVFIKKLSTDLGFSRSDYANLLAPMYSDGKMVYPCFFYSKMLFLHMIKNKKNILIVINNGISSSMIQILFEHGNTYGVLVHKNIKNNFEDQTCMVISCVRNVQLKLTPEELLKKINGFGLYNILLMNMASHPQFSGAKLAYLEHSLMSYDKTPTSKEKEMAYELNLFKGNAETLGFSRENKSLLVIKHIFMSTLTNEILSKREKNEFVREKALI